MGLRDPLPADEVTRRLAALDGWVKATDREEIHKTFPVEYYAAIEALGAVAESAKELEHHPDVELHWGELTFSLTTYSAGQRITELDFRLVDRIESVLAGYVQTDAAG
ncbi:4a-hydroxytetrahydrobiopterin dehydratase [Parafrankia sp. EUN1f]|uniref:4a-hydroxytetrahydrobiopterin dehydratase n=1 Tax=Parafrankia sp. EUN1f TaxID=102897 RepID=UPI0001C477AC|nr:4a-hydroxytetrahydrobiopterin dehydratase [Parafrankia sp. EUN1f]EFC86839.1 transcriptional coactivator/pterin dehydratase [Parafrankia sp. EUN1f]